VLVVVVRAIVLVFVVFEASHTPDDG